MLEFLYIAYTDALGRDPAEISQGFVDLNDHMEGVVSLDENNAIFSIVCGLCSACEKRAFIDAIQIGAQLMLESSPLDLLIVSLGTNDLKYADAPSLGRAMRQLLRSAKHSGLWNVNNNSVFRDKERILLISPIPLGADLDERFPNSVLYGKYELSLRFAEIYQPICKAFDVEFLDASQYAEPSKADCIHMDADSHEKLANAIYQKVLDILGTK